MPSKKNYRVYIHPCSLLGRPCTHVLYLICSCLRGTVHTCSLAWDGWLLSFLASWEIVHTCSFSIISQYISEGNMLCFRPNSQFCLNMCLWFVQLTLLGQIICLMNLYGMLLFKWSNWASSIGCWVLTMLLQFFVRSKLLVFTSVLTFLRRVMPDIFLLFFSIY